MKKLLIVLVLFILLGYSIYVNHWTAYLSSSFAGCILGHLVAKEYLRRKK